MSDPGVLVAFLGGLLALLSPCSALLLPAFFAYSSTSRTRSWAARHCSTPDSASPWCHWAWPAPSPDGGTSALPSLTGVDAEFTWEERLSRWAGAIPDRTLLLGLSTVAALASLLRTRPGRKEERHPSAENVHADGTGKEHR
ncbi:hypothetical protein GCM10010287_13660 [Streptomyces variabilis]|uniref:Uncharacterized protein n=1 Tax=Streptomyces variabilis TaxID=67372 RepID=A0ABQ2TTY9_9ACTN|nr:hypothetical protein GCM10010265_24850 [Streptomyces griseoincarnatus]GGT42013.1 hypothetical protein GCM10010287_13660 [Streptomyces variabilis]